LPMRSALPTEVPPYFWTISAIKDLYVPLAEPRRGVRNAKVRGLNYRTGTD
jgi:hypothetical protein